MLWRCDALDESLRDSQPKLAPAASTATRLCNKAQGWTEGTTLGSGDGGVINPNGVVPGGDRRRLVFRSPGRNPVGVEGHCRAITQGWRRANPGLCYTIPLGLERRGLSLAEGIWAKAQVRIHFVWANCICGSVVRSERFSTGCRWLSPLALKRSSSSAKP